MTRLDPANEPALTWPSLPRRIELAGGWVRITRPQKIDGRTADNADWDDETRHIRVRRALTNSEAWKYLFHELVHAWLDDSRMFVEVVPLTSKQEEAICEILASGLHFRMRRDLERRSRKPHK